jgi:hypothetical protein
MGEVRVMERHGSHLLVEREGRYAVVEERNGEIYGVGSVPRRGHPRTATGIGAAVGKDGWHDEAEARRLFLEVTERGDDLARRLW